MNIKTERVITKYLSIQIWDLIVTIYCQSCHLQKDLLTMLAWIVVMQFRKKIFLSFFLKKKKIVFEQEFESDKIITELSQNQSKSKSSSKNLRGAVMEVQTTLRASKKIILRNNLIENSYSHLYMYSHYHFLIKFQHQSFLSNFFSNNNKIMQLFFAFLPIIIIKRKRFKFFFKK